MSEPERTPTFIFGGFDSPTTTQVPDAFFDVVAPELGEAELRVALYIIRRTFGFKKDSDTISLRQMVEGITTKDGRVLDRGTGLKKSAVANALNGLERKGIIVTRRNRSAERGNEPTTYALHIKGHPLSVPVDKGLSVPVDKPLSVPVDIQHTVEQHTVEQQTDVTSNGFDGFANIQQSQTNSKFSKKRVSDANSRKAPSPERRAGTGGMTAVGQILHRRRTPTPRYAPVTPETTPETAANGQPDVEHPTDPSRAPERPRRGRPHALSPYLADLVDRYSNELHDEDHAAQNRGQAARLWKASGWSEAAFSQALVEAKAITLTYDIQKRARVGGELGLRNKMPYFFTVVRDLLGQADADARGGET